MIGINKVYEGLQKNDLSGLTKEELRKIDWKKYDGIYSLIETGLLQTVKKAVAQKGTVKQYFMDLIKEADNTNKPNPEIAWLETYAKINGVLDSQKNTGKGSKELINFLENFDLKITDNGVRLEISPILKQHSDELAKLQGEIIAPVIEAPKGPNKVKPDQGKTKPQPSSKSKPTKTNKPSHTAVAPQKVEEKTSKDELNKLVKEVAALREKLNGEQTLVFKNMGSLESYKEVNILHSEDPNVDINYNELPSKDESEESSNPTIIDKKYDQLAEKKGQLDETDLNKKGVNLKGVPRSYESLIREFQSFKKMLEELLKVNTIIKDLFDGKTTEIFKGELENSLNELGKTDLSLNRTMILVSMEKLDQLGKVDYNKPQWGNDGLNIWIPLLDFRSNEILLLFLGKEYSDSIKTLNNTHADFNYNYEKYKSKLKVNVVPYLEAMPGEIVKITGSSLLRTTDDYKKLTLRATLLNTEIVEVINMMKAADDPTKKLIPIRKETLDKLEIEIKPNWLKDTANGKIVIPREDLFN